MNKYAVTLSDGRTVIFEENSEEAATRAAERWERLNPNGQDIGEYEVTLENGDVRRIPAVSEDAAIEFVSAWGPEQRARADAEARQAGASGTSLSGEQSPYDASTNAVNSASLGLDKILNAGAQAAVTGFQNATGEGPGYGAMDAFNASREAENAAQREWQSSAPDGGLLSSLLGGGAMVGGPSAARFIAGPTRQAAQGLTSGLLRVGGSSLRAGAVGAPVGATAGLLNSDPGDELGATGRGAIIGGVTSLAIPLAAGAASGVTRNLGRGALRTLNTVTGGNVPGLRGGSPDRQAMIRLAEAMREDGLDPQTIRAGLNNAMQTGIGDNLLDVIGQNATRTRALIQGAAMKPGPAMTTAGQYREGVEAGLQEQAIDQAYRLTPGESRGAAAYSDDLSSANRQLSDVTYAEPYQSRVTLDDEARRALEDMGPQIGSARQESSFRFPQQAADIDALASGQAGDVSAAALDRINRQIRTTGRNLTRSLTDPNPGLAADYNARGEAIDGILDQVPGLLPARAAYRGYANAEDATELGLSGLMPKTRPEDYRHALDVLEQIEGRSEMAAGFPLPSARGSAGVGVRDQMVQTIGNMPDGATGFLNRLADAPNPTQVLNATYGDAAQPFQQNIGALVDSVKNARFIDSTTGSQTANRLVASEPLPTGGLFSMAIQAINKVRRGLTLTDEEREAIVRLSTQRGNAPQIPNLPSLAPTVSGRLAPVAAGQTGG